MEALLLTTVVLENSAQMFLPLSLPLAVERLRRTWKEKARQVSADQRGGRGGSFGEELPMIWKRFILMLHWECKWRLSATVRVIVKRAWNVLGMVWNTYNICEGKLPYSHFVKLVFLASTLEDLWDIQWQKFITDGEWNVTHVHWGKHVPVYICFLLAKILLEMFIPFFGYHTILLMCLLWYIVPF